MSPSVHRQRARKAAENDRRLAAIRATEHDLQKQIVDAIRLCGLTVYETTAYKQKGASGIDKGIPDLLVSIPGFHYWFFGIEVKRPGVVKWSSAEQQEAFERCRFVVASDANEALAHLWNGVWALAGFSNREGIMKRISSVQDALRGRNEQRGQR